MKKRYVFDVTSNKTKDMQRRLKRIKRLAHDLPVLGDNSEEVKIRTRDTTTTLTLYPASWKQLIALALTYAIMINIIKHSLYFFYGTPQFHFSDPKLEAEYQYLEEKYSSSVK